MTDLAREDDQWTSRTLQSDSLRASGEWHRVVPDEHRQRAAAAAAGREPHIRVRGEVDQTYVRITIEDTGPGIPAESLNRIFQPFVTTKAQGTGLGLSIVLKVIVSHNGRIAASNRAEGGARFRIQLPVLTTHR